MKPDASHLEACSFDCTTEGHASACRPAIGPGQVNPIPRGTAWPAYPYFFTVLCVLLTLPVKIALNSLVPQVPSTIAFLCPVMIAAWVGGPRQGLLAVFFTLPFCLYFCSPENGSISIASHEDAFGISLFIVGGMLLSALFGSLPFAKERMATMAAELQLQQENQLRQRTSELTQAIRELQLEIAQRKQAQETLAGEREFLLTVFQNISDGVIACDANEVLTLFNRAAEQFHGRQAESVPQEQRADYYGLYKPDGITLLTREETPLHRCFHGEIVRDAELVIISGKGERRSIVASGQPLWSAEGRKLGAVLVLRDVTEWKRAEEQIRNLNARLELRLERLGSLRRIDLAINSSLDLRATLATLVDLILPQLHVDAVAILLLDPHTHRLEYAYGRGFRGSEISRTTFCLGEGLAGCAAIERRLIQGSSIDGDCDRSRSALLESEGFVAYYSVPLLAKGKIKGVLQVFHRSALEPDGEWLDYLNTLGGQAAIAIDSVSTFDQLQRSNAELVLAYDATIEGWSRALDLRDKETEGHSHRVSELTLRLARRMGVSGPELTNLYRGALLHDIGKMGIPDTILLKPGALNDHEWQIMRRHPDYAYDLLSPIPYLLPAIDIPYCHHEKWDGTGYPRGLRGEQIPKAARLFAVVDIWDALLSDRPYRKGWPEDRVVDHLRSLAGTHLDPEAVEAFIQMLASDEGGQEILHRDQRIGQWGTDHRIDQSQVEESGPRTVAVQLANAPPTRPGLWTDGPDSRLSSEADDHLDTSASTESAEQCPTILLAGIQDQPTEFLVRSTLRDSAHAVITAADGDEAWRIVEQGHARVVVAEWQMPWLDGPELCHRIRRMTGTPYTYIILITAEVENRDRLAALTAGADDFLVKPLDSRELAVRLEAAQRILARQRDLERDNARLARQASIDDLTGLKNRRHFREALGAAFSFAQRENHSLSVIMLDVDQFKHFNDTYGHPAGDEVLRAVADSMCAEIRPHDLAARLGGDEFAVILPAADGEAGMTIAERLRIAVAGRTSRLRPVTVSLGVATISLSSTSASQLIEESDEALYISKQAGRNRVTHYQALLATSNRGLSVSV